MTYRSVFFTLMTLISPKTFSSSPYYAINCSTSRYTPKNAPRSSYGVPTGHAVSYFHGLCKKFPQEIRFNESPHQIRFCNFNEFSSNSGVGVSTDGAYFNLAMSITSGLDNFFNGFGEKTSPSFFDQQRKQEIVERRANSHDFDQATLTTKYLPSELHEAYHQALNNPRPHALQTFVANWTFGTDYAISWARDSICLFEEKSLEEMQDIVAVFNHYNNKIWNEAKKRQDDSVSLFYSPFWNNCADRCDAIQNPEHEKNKDLMTIPGKFLLERYQSLQNTQIKHYLFRVPFRAEGNQLYADTFDPITQRPFMTVGIIPTLLAKYLDESSFNYLKSLMSVEDFRRELTTILNHSQLMDEELLKFLMLAIDQATTLDQFIQLIDIEAKELFSLIQQK